MALFPLIAWGTLGTTIGNYFWYWVGARVGYQRLRPFVERNGRWLTLEWEDVERIHRFFIRHGHWVIFAFRFMPNGRTIISLPAGLTLRAADFERLWSQRRETLQKTRYSWDDGPFHWDVDFFKTDEGCTYFAQAEVEMPERQTTPPPLPGRLASRLLATAPVGDQRFTSKRLADRAHAAQLLAEIRRKGEVE